MSEVSSDPRSASSRLAVQKRLGWVGAVLAMFVSAPIVLAANTDHRLTTTGTSNLSTATFTNGTPGTGTAGDVLSYSNASTSATLTLDAALTIGAIRQFNDAVLTIAPGSTTSFTLDGTGLTTNISNTADVAFIGQLAGGSPGSLAVSADVVLATDVEIGSLQAAGKNITITGAMTANTAVDLVYRSNGVGGNSVLINHNGSIGASGSDITITNLSTGGNLVNINGALGASVVSVTQNSTNTPLVLAANNANFVGSVTLQQGALRLNNANALGKTGAGGTFTIAGGTLSNTSGAAITLLSNNAIAWNGDFVFNATNGALNLGTGAVTLNGNRSVTVANSDLTIGGAIGGVGFGITKLSSNALNLTGASTYSGATVIGTVGSNSSAGVLSVGTATVGTGSINGTSGVTITGTGSFLTLNNTTAVAERLNDAAVVNMSIGAQFSIINNATASTLTKETIGGIAIGQGNVIITSSGTSSGVLDHLEIGSAGFTRTSAGTALVRGSNLGTQSTNATRITVDGTAATGLTFGGSTVVSAAGAGGGSVKNVRIIPYLVGDTTNSGVGSSFLTYDTHATTGGLRLLNASNEYDAPTASYTTVGNNVRYATAGTFTMTTGTSRQFNSLVLTANTTFAGNSADNLTIDSGAMLLTGGTTAISGWNKLTLGNGEGIVFVTSTNTSTFNTPVDVTSNGGLVKAGAGTLILSGQNLYTGTTTVNQGTVRIGDGTAGNLAAGSGAVTVVAGATLNLNLAASATLANDIVNNGTLNKTLGATVNTVSGNITGTGVVTQNIAGGTLVLSGNNSYAGATTVTTGKLLLNGTHAIAGATNVGAYAVASTATLGGSGSTDGAVTISNGGFIAPGNGIGTLGTGNLSIAGTSTYLAEVDFDNTKSFANGTFYSSDTIDVTGSVTLGGILQLDLGSNVEAFAPGRTVVLITNDGTDAVSSTFSQIRPANGSPLVAFTISYTFNADNSGANNDVAITFTSVPEPGSAVMAVAMAGGCLLCRRNRRK